MRDRLRTTYHNTQCGRRIKSSRIYNHKMQKFCFIAFAVVLACSSVNSARILVLFTVTIKSHVVAFQPLIDELAARGHDMTVVTAFPKKNTPKNYNEIIIQDTFPPRDPSGMNFFEIKKMNSFTMMFFYMKVFCDSCEKLLKQPNIQKLIEENESEYDLIIYEPFISQCIYGLLYKHKAPTIQIFPNSLPTWTEDVKGNPTAISYVPDLLSQTENLDFTERFFSFVRVLSARAANYLYLEAKMDSIMKEHFRDPSLPGVHEIEKNSSLLLLQTHPLLHYPRPLTPNTVEVAGLHIKTSNNIPQDLKLFLDSAPHGVIYFSLGSNVRSVDMPEDKKRAILRSFSKLKQRVVWKWEDNTLPGQPENVRLGKWLPQHDILAHPNVKLFITHGGLMSMQESIYFGVPLVAIPVMGDQFFYSMQAQNRGYAVVLHVQNITEESLDWAINEVLHEPRYGERAQQLSKIFRDQPQTPLERAVYWVEFTIRHKGAPHLISGALKLNTVQYYLLDVIAVHVLVTCISLLILFKVTKCVVRKIFTKSNSTIQKKQE